MKFIIKGIFIDTVNKSKLRIRKGSILVNDGIIEGFSDLDINDSNIKVYDYENKLIIPGFTDLHLHAPQYSYCGTSMDLELLEWLNTYTFPEESKYKDIEYAKKNYPIFVNDLLESATTRACIFASIHTDATIELMKELEDKKIVAYVGKVSMDRNSPDYYIESNGVEETERYIEESNKCNFKYVKPIITPRFTPSVTDEYMEELGKLALKYSLPAQSHLSENDNEIKWVKDLRPNDNYYYESYSKYNLFGGKTKTVMAHCIHSSEEENNAIKENGVYIAHCPTSNINVIAGISPAAMYLRHGYNIGLGSDVAGGNTLDLFEVMRVAIQSSKIRYKYVDNQIKPLTLPEVLYLATEGGGSFFGKVGSFNPGYEFDCLVLDDSKLLNNRNFTESERLERFIYLKDGKIEAKFIKGNKVK